MALSSYNKKTAIVLVNLGTPDSPTPKGVRAYLKEFLSDTRVIEIPVFIWQVILWLFVLTTRPQKVAHAYQSIWTDDGSPLLAILKQQAHALQNHLQTDVFFAMTYGNPNIKQVLADVQKEGFNRLVILPLYPQHSATTTAAVFDKVAEYFKSIRDLPELIFLRDYHDHPLYLQALSKSVRDFWEKNGRADKLLMSFHGIPKPYADKGDPYADECRKTAVLLASELGLASHEWQMSFQSRFGAQEWLKPYTDELLSEWGHQGLSVQVISPAFSADCLETLEELAVENRDNFLQAGGKNYAYIPALNANSEHILLMADLIKPYIQKA